MATYLVTGGAGFIGSHLATALCDDGHAVRIVDSLATGSRANLSHIADRVEFIEGDLADLDVARRAVADVEFVLHQAAIPSVPRSVADPLASNRANIDVTLNVLVAARDVGARRVVFAGSSSVYGDTPTLPKREDMRPTPLSPYALQKLVGEQYAAMFTSLFGLQTVTIRYFNVFGPRQDPSSPYSGVISRFSQAVIDGARPIVYGDGEQTRDFTYVDNVVDGVLRAAVTEKASGAVINVAMGRRTSLNGLIAMLRDISGAALDVHYEPPRVGDVRDSLADIGLARRLLGYTPSVSLEEGLRRTLEWFRSEAGATEEMGPGTADRREA